MNETDRKQAVSHAIRRARDHSPFLKFQLETRPEAADALARGDVAAAVALARREGGGAEVDGRGPAGAKRPGAGAGDRRAGRPVHARGRRRRAFRARRPGARARAGRRDRGAHARGGARRASPIIALGKLGGRELNYSSDVDLVFLYDPATLPRKPREEPDQAALRIGQRIVEILQKRTEEGYAFRVDLQAAARRPR